MRQLLARQSAQLLAEGPGRVQRLRPCTVGIATSVTGESARSTSSSSTSRPQAVQLVARAGTAGVDVAPSQYAGTAVAVVAAAAQARLVLRSSVRVDLRWSGAGAKRAFAEVPRGGPTSSGVPSEGQGSECKGSEGKVRQEPAGSSARSRGSGSTPVEERASESSHGSTNSGRADDASSGDGGGGSSSRSSGSWQASGAARMKELQAQLEQLTRLHQKVEVSSRVIIGVVVTSVLGAGFVITNWRAVRSGVSKESADLIAETIRDKQLQFTAHEFSKELIHQVLNDDDIARTVGKWVMSLLEKIQDDIGALVVKILHQDQVVEAVNRLADRLIAYLCSNKYIQEQVGNLLVKAICLQSTRDSAAVWAYELVMRDDIKGGFRDLVVSALQMDEVVSEAHTLSVFVVNRVLQDPQTLAEVRKVLLQTLRDGELRATAKESLWSVVTPWGAGRAARNDSRARKIELAKALDDLMALDGVTPEERQVLKSVQDRVRTAGAVVDAPSSDGKDDKVAEPAAKETFKVDQPKPASPPETDVAEKFASHAASVDERVEGQITEEISPPIASRSSGKDDKAAVQTEVKGKDATETHEMDRDDRPTPKEQVQQAVSTPAKEVKQGELDKGVVVEQQQAGCEKTADGAPSKADKVDETRPKVETRDMVNPDTENMLGVDQGEGHVDPTNGLAAPGAADVDAESVRRISSGEDLQDGPISEQGSKGETPQKTCDRADHPTEGQPAEERVAEAGRAAEEAPKEEVPQPAAVQAEVASEAAKEKGGGERPTEGRSISDQAGSEVEQAAPDEGSEAGGQGPGARIEKGMKEVEHDEQKVVEESGKEPQNPENRPDIEEKASETPPKRNAVVNFFMRWVPAVLPTPTTPTGTPDSSGAPTSLREMPDSAAAPTAPTEMPGNAGVPAAPAKTFESDGDGGLAPAAPAESTGGVASFFTRWLPGGGSSSPTPAAPAESPDSSGAPAAPAEMPGSSGSAAADHAETPGSGGDGGLAASTPAQSTDGAGSSSAPVAPAESAGSSGPKVAPAGPASGGGEPVAPVQSAGSGGTPVVPHRAGKSDEVKRHD